MTPSSRLRAPAAALAALLVLAPAFAAGEFYGRETQPNEVVTTTIAPADDVDDFAFQGAAGWKVSAQVKRGKTSTLSPVLELVDPYGVVQASGVVVKSTATSSKLTAVLAVGGRHALRLRGAAGTGDCQIKWKLAPARIAGIRNGAVGANVVQPFLFPARGGALVSWSLKFKGDGSVQVNGVLDPDGKDAGFDPADETWVTRKFTSEKVKDFPLPASSPGGLWSLQVESKFAPAVYSLSVSVKLPRLAPVSVVLTAAEPRLTGISSTYGSCGAPVSLAGENLSASPRGVYFGGNAASGVLGVSATEVSCRVPSGTGTADVVLVNEDGQVAALPGAYTFQPPPVLTSFDPVVGPGTGGTPFTLHGSGFQEGVAGLYFVIIGGVAGSQVRVLDSETITCKTPANVAGAKTVVLRNACGEEVTAPGTFTYGAGLYITTVQPNAVPVFGGMEVTISGTNFSLTDRVYLDTTEIPTTPIYFQTAVVGHRIEAADLPAHAPGKVDVRIVPPLGNPSVKVGGLSYFTFTDATASLIPAASATDDWGGVSNALADMDADGKIDTIFVADTAKLSTTRPGTRVLKGNGTGGAFSDITASAMPGPSGTEGYEANAVLVGRMNSSDSYPDIFLSRPGTGVNWDKGNDGSIDWIEARMQSNQKFVEPWGMVLFADSPTKFSAQTVSGALGLLAISGFVECNSTWACGGQDRGTSVCKMYDYDFRSVNACLGDLDGDFDQDVVLVNDASLADFTGTSQGTWVSCYGYGYVDYQYYTATAFGHATRILTLGSNGGLSDRTQNFMETKATAEEDFRAVGATVADMTSDFLNDILVVHNQGILKGGSPVSAARLLVQRNSGASVTFRQSTSFFPAPSGGDDWRGDAIAAADLNSDFYRDVIVSVDGPPVGSSTLATRLLLQDTSNYRLVDRTSTVLAGLFPSGDDGRAKVVLCRDIDKDNDQDLILSTPGSTGTGNRRTRLFLSIGPDPVTGYPRFVDGSALLPAEASDDGAAVAVSLGDIDGDGDLDLVLTDTHRTSGTPVRRTRIWKQDR